VIELRSFVAVISVVSVSVAGTATTVHAQVDDSSIVRLMGEHSVPGLALAVVTPDSTVLRGFGSTRPEDGQAVTPETPFRVASVAKVLVAATVLAEARAGRVDLKADIAGSVDVPLEGDYAGPVTLHDLMTHTRSLR